ncbi:MAG: CHAP domain-containing protein [Ktedonobacteraceae bacterium]
MHIHRQVWHYIQHHTKVRLLLIPLLALIVLGATIGINIRGADAQIRCARGDAVHTIVWGDSLGRIAAHYHVSWQSLAAYNHIANPNQIYVNQHICIPGKGSSPGGSGGHGATGTGDYFPYGQCTWWAAHRYFQMHGVYEPWTSQSDAWQWTARAYQFGWHVSSSPQVGDIVDLQPWTQGAYAYGHVAIVEQVLGNGHVIASNMNWGSHPQQVTRVEFSSGRGVTFIHR